MKKRIIQFSLLFLSTSGATFGQQYVDNKVLPRHPSQSAADHYGKSIALSEGYTLVGSAEDDMREDSCRKYRNQSNGGAILYKDGVVLRKYQVANTYNPFSDIRQDRSYGGQSVSIQAQKWIAIGAPGYGGKGAVFLILKGSSEFGTSITYTITVPTLPGLNTSLTDIKFGNSVAVDRNVLVIGAPGATVDGVQSGAFFIYRFVNNAWAFERWFKSPNAQASGNFGHAVAMSESEEKIIIGAPGESNQGFAYIFHKAGTEWILKYNFTQSWSESLKVGSSVDITNDNAIIGGSSDTYSDGIHSLVKILHWTGSSWNSEFTAYTANVGDVAIEGHKAVYGQPWSVDFSGRVVQLERWSSSWIQKSAIGLQHQYSRFGYSVDLSNNFVAAGAYGWDFPDISETCFNPTPDEEAGGGFRYQFDGYNGNQYRSETEETEVENSMATSVTISPNPSTSGIVMITSNNDILEVQVSQATGNSWSMYPENGLLDVSALQPGLYLLQVKTANGTSIQKLVVN